MKTPPIPRVWALDVSADADNNATDGFLAQQKRSVGVPYHFKHSRSDDCPSFKLYVQDDFNENPARPVQKR